MWKNNNICDLELLTDKEVQLYVQLKNKKKDKKELYSEFFDNLTRAGAYLFISSIGAAGIAKGLIDEETLFVAFGSLISLGGLIGAVSRGYTCSENLDDIRKIKKDVNFLKTTQEYKSIEQKIN